MRVVCSTLAFFCAVLLSGVSFAQDPPAEPPPPPTTGNVSFGFALTAGNKDTSTLNASYEIKHDPKTRNVIKSSGLFLRGKTDDELTAEQYGLTVRDEYTFSKRAFAFGELRYLHDEFKQISYLLSPTVGAGYRFIDTEPTVLSTSVGVGGVWEKNPGLDVRASGALTAEEKLTHALSKTATITQSVGALWKMNDFDDALYTFGAAIAVAITTQAQLKVELLDTYKNKPPTPDVQKNDVALITAVVYKF